MLGRGERLRPSAAVAAVAIAACVVAGAALAAGPRERATALTGSSQWTSGYAIAGTFDGGLGRGTYSGTMTAAGPTFTSSTCGPVCAPLAGSITFSGRVGGGGISAAFVRTEAGAPKRKDSARFTRC